MIVCIAEKPSVGRDIAKVLGANTARDGYMEGNGYCVTWTFGHLCALFDPDEYDDRWKQWNLSSLPMIPQRFAIKVTNDKGVQKQFNTIRTLIAQADEVINCGDAGQEGELIQRWVQQKAGCKCPVRRLWISSLTTEAIQEGFRQLKPQTDYQHLYEAGLMRAIGDWLLGMNATRAYTLRYRNESRQVLSIGRVQTPTLALIVSRQFQIEHFVPKTYWELKTAYRNTLFSAIVRKSDEELAEMLDKLTQQQQKKQKTASLPTMEDLQRKNLGIDAVASAEEGNKWVERLSGQPFLVKTVEKKKANEAAPRLFDLTSLQVECNKRFSYSADETLRLVQSLYEKKVSTYPRVDTTYLSEDIYPKCGSILKGIEPFFKAQIDPLHGKPLRKSRKVFDNGKVTDHHAIIPTGQAPDNLTEQERKVFGCIALRFIAAFYPDCEVSTTTVTGAVSASDSGEEVLFRTSGRQILSAGWRSVFDKGATALVPSEQEEANEDTGAKTQDTVTLPDFRKGETGGQQPRLAEKQTTPPKYYTEATLLRAMETAGKTVDDDELRDALKDNGIGRPSTRAAIIEKLFQRQYIVRSGKSIKATPVGVSLIQTIHFPLLKSAELTGQWEKKLRQIERGDYEAPLFLDELKQLTTEVIRELKANKAGMLCPVCRKGTVIRGKTAYGCSRWREGCNYREPFNN